jgi:hypothetical protein
MAESIDILISNQTALVARLRSELLEAEGVLRGMEAIRNVLPEQFTKSKGLSSNASSIANGQSLSEKSGYKGGRQPGAISSTWRKILSDVYWQARKGAIPFGIDVSTLVRIAQENKVSIRPAEATKRMEHYAGFGYVVIENSCFKVTDDAATKFAFKNGPLSLDNVSLDNGNSPMAVNIFS